MPASLRKFQFTLILSGALVFIVDQITKLLSREIPANGIFLFSTKLHNIQSNELCTAIKSSEACTAALSLKLQYAENPFVAFSLPIPWIVTIILSGLILIGLIYYLRKFWLNQQVLSSFALVIILSAAWSNLLDRLIQKNVIDFISVTIYNYNWPTFNLADTFIVAGTALLLISLLKTKKI